MTSSHNTQTTPSYYEPPAASGDLEQHKLRVLIDEVATLRGLTIQISLRLVSLAAAPNEDQRQQVCAEFHTLRRQFRANMEMLFGIESPEAENRAQVEWIRTIIGANSERRAALLDVEADIQSLVKSLDAGEIPTFAEARQFFEKNWPVVRDKMTEVIWDLWADLDVQKLEAVKKNSTLQEALQDTLSDIKHFSVAIRMIAINAAILATRPEDAGAGFSAISKEVKQLSEDIEASANRATEAIDGLSQ